MFTRLTTPALLLALTATVGVADEALPRVLISTSEGDIIVELDDRKAPATVENFLGYVDERFYDGTIFHRVIPRFMAQGGGFTEDFVQKRTGKAVRNEADNGLQNRRGTIAMARTADPHSATAQFFINTVDNDFLDFSSPTPNGWGYAVFGRVVEGMEVVDRIEAIPTGRGGPFPRDVPRQTIVINRVERLPAGESPDAGS